LAEILKALGRGTSRCPKRRFAPLRDPAYFARLRADAEAGTIVWPNDADIAPETLYSHARQRLTATA
jgi:hypothetical protein